MFRLVRLAPLYMALCLGANAAVAGGLSDLLTGDMRAMALTESPQPLPEVHFSDPEGTDLTLADFEGRYILLNFWATWCAPCRLEMPSLNSLQQQLGGEDFAVVTIASGRNPLPAITRFFAEVGVTDLPVYLDPRQSMTRQLGVFGLPTTILIDPQGQEIGRLRGDADWSGEEALTLLMAVIASADE